MTAPLSIPDLVRPAFFDGERLGADDLAAIYDLSTASCAGCTTARCTAGGSPLGFGVAGRKGGREVTVAPGYALDCQGRDLVLSRPVVLPVPAVPGAPAGGPALYYLTASYRRMRTCRLTNRARGCAVGKARCGASSERGSAFRTRATSATPTRASGAASTSCSRESSSRIARSPRLRRPPNRRDARPPTQPFVAAGSTPAGDTAWQFFPGAVRASGCRLSSTRRAAGFQRTPSYSAHVVGTRLLAANGPIIDGIDVDRSSPRQRASSSVSRCRATCRRGIVAQPSGRVRRPATLHAAAHPTELERLVDGSGGTRMSTRCPRSSTSRCAGGWPQRRAQRRARSAQVPS